MVIELVLPPVRTDQTPSEGNHAEDHNLIRAALLTLSGADVDTEDANRLLYVPQPELEEHTYVTPGTRISDDEGLWPYGADVVAWTVELVPSASGTITSPPPPASIKAAIFLASKAETDAAIAQVDAADLGMTFDFYTPVGEADGSGGDGPVGFSVTVEEGETYTLLLVQTDPTTAEVVDLSELVSYVLAEWSMVDPFTDPGRAFTVELDDEGRLGLVPAYRQEGNPVGGAEEGTYFAPLAGSFASAGAFALGANVQGSGSVGIGSGVVTADGDNAVLIGSGWLAHTGATLLGSRNAGAYSWRDNELAWGHSQLSHRAALSSPGDTNSASGSRTILDVVLQPQSTCFVHAFVVGHNTAVSQAVVWEVQALYARGSVGDARVVWSSVTELGGDAGAPASWDVAVSISAGSGIITGTGGGTSVHFGAQGLTTEHKTYGVALSANP